MQINLSSSVSSGTCFALTWLSIRSLLVVTKLHSKQVYLKEFSSVSFRFSIYRLLTVSSSTISLSMMELFLVDSLGPITLFDKLKLWLCSVLLCLFKVEILFAAKSQPLHGKALPFLYLISDLFTVFGPSFAIISLCQDFVILFKG